MGAGLLQFASLGFEPLYYRPHGAGDWSGHIPFAYDLVSDFRPSRIVELGTYYGESYFAFCQAVAECGVECQASAVDTWRGDSQTGAYGEAVFREVSAHNQKHYEHFSTLLRERFDDARKHFADGSIDLLHIDGLHTYGAVRHDFDNWFPKVSPGGVVLLHDTQIRNDNFGVWRLWKELRTDYENFEFVHSCGLGVIRKPGGAGALTGLAGLLFGDRERAGAVCRFYRISGERLEYKDRLEWQQTRGKWAILAKLYWRETSQEFSEERSTHVRGEVAVFPKGIRMELPRGAAFEQLRFDLLESPPFMRLHAIRLLGPNGTLFWSLPMLRVQEFLTSSGVRFSPEYNGCSVVSRISGGEGSVCLKLSQAVLDQLGAGGELELELSGLAPEDGATALESLLQQALNRAEAADRRAAALQDETNVLTRGLAEAQDVVRRQQSEVAALTRGLAEAQDVVQRQQSEMAALTRGLAGAQDLARQRESKLSTYDQALCRAQKLALEREAELNSLHRKYGEVLDGLRRAEESLAFQEARANKLAELFEQTRREFAGRVDQPCIVATPFSELQLEATTREQALAEAREKLRQESDSEHS